MVLKGKGEKLGISHDGASASQLAPEPVPALVTVSHVSHPNPPRRPIPIRKVRPRVFERGVPRPIYVFSHCKKRGDLREFCFILGYVSRYTSAHVRTHAPTHDTLLAHIREQLKFLVKTSHDLMECFKRCHRIWETPLNLLDEV